jgi:hypothetical protein
MGAGNEAAVADRSSVHDDVVIFSSDWLPHGKALPSTQAPANGGCDVSDPDCLRPPRFNHGLDDPHMIR